jgi:hypothetical protein
LIKSIRALPWKFRASQIKRAKLFLEFRPIDLTLLALQGIGPGEIGQEYTSFQFEFGIYLVMQLPKFGSASQRDEGAPIKVNLKSEE